MTTVREPLWCLRCERMAVVQAGHWNKPDVSHRICLDCTYCRECDV